MTAVVRTHKNVEAMLQERMEKTYEGAWKKKTDDGHVKSFLAESHLRSGKAVEQLQEISERCQESFGKDSFEFEQLDDPTLFLIKAKEDDRTPAHIYVDTRGGRFWKLHTTSLSAKVDTPLEKLINVTPHLDRVWLAEDFLMKMSGWGDFRGFKVEHNRIQYPSADDTGKRARKVLESSFKIDSKSSLSDDLSEQLLRVIRADDKLKSHSSVSGLRIRSADDWDPEDPAEPDFCIDDIAFNGKFRTRGNSLNHHVSLLESSLRIYRLALSNIEKNCIRNHGTKGHPFILKFSDARPLTNLEGFCHFVFSAEPIFKLFGLPEKIGPDAYRVECTDIHSGGQLQVDVFPTYLKFYLFENACGNSLLRFYSNLQKYQDAQITLKDHRGGDFDFFFE